MPRIIAGAAGGRRISAPEGRDTRPTGDRAREALFASAQSELGSFEGLRVLDLYAGSGALGLEALSRGAVRVLLVESDRRAAAAIRRNIAALGLPGARVTAERVERVLARGPEDGPFDLLLADPPYAVPGAEVAAVLQAAHGWLTPEALVVVERSIRGPALEWPDGYVAARVRRYGEAALWYGHAAGRRGPG